MGKLLRSLPWFSWSCLLTAVLFVMFTHDLRAQTVFPNIDVRGTIVNTDSGEAVVINDNASVTGTLGVTGTLSATAITASGALDLQGTVADSTGNLTLGDTVDISGALNVTGLGTFNTLTVTTCTGCVSGGGGATLSGNNTFTGNNAFNTGTFTIGTLTGLLQGNGASAVSAITNSSTVGQALRVTGAATYAWGALDLADTDAVTGILPVANGGLNLSSATDDAVPTGNGTTWQAKVIPNCLDSSGNHLNYTQSTNTWSCGNTGDGSGTGSPGGSDTHVQYNDGGVFGGEAGLTYNETTDSLTAAGTVTAEQLTSTDDITATDLIQGADLTATDDLSVGDDAVITDTLTVKGVDITPTFDTFEVTWETGCSTTPSQTWIYQKIGHEITLQMIDNVSCTGDATTMSAGTDLPAALRPTGTLLLRTFKSIRGLDNGVATALCLNIDTAGNMALFTDTAGVCGGAWTAAGTRFIDATGGTGETSFTYVLE